ncbi:transporter substrate-binding domain-containing protein [Terasakiella sp. A23]|nr:transporter substrate-binding domain-containing protein [Terasakiella sp. A23]
MKPVTIGVSALKDMTKDPVTGKWHGGIASYLSELETVIGRQIDINVLPFARVVELVKKSKLDLGIFIENTQRNRVAVKLTHVAATEIVIASKSTSPIKQFSDISGKKIGYSSKGSIVTNLKSIPNAILVKLQDPSALLTALSSGKVDAIATPDVRFIEEVVLQGLDFMDFSIFLPFEQRYYTLYSSKKFAATNPQTIKKITSHTHSVVTDFALMKLKSIYGNEFNN